MVDSTGDPTSIQPTITYPVEAVIGHRYGLEIDLQVEGGWPYEEKEEFPIYCFVEAAPLFAITSGSLEQSAIILHRFGGSYEPTRFELTASEKECQGSIRIVLANESGIPIHVISLNDISVRKFPLKIPETLLLEANEDESSYIIQIVIPADCEVESYNENIRVEPTKLKAGSNKIELHVKKPPSDTSKVEGRISFTLDSGRRNTQVEVRFGKSPESGEKVVWKARGWSRYQPTTPNGALVLNQTPWTPVLLGTSSLDVEKGRQTDDRSPYSQIPAIFLNEPAQYPDRAVPSSSGSTSQTSEDFPQIERIAPKAASRDLSNILSVPNTVARPTYPLAKVRVIESSDESYEVVVHFMPDPDQIFGEQETRSFLALDASLSMKKMYGLGGLFGEEPNYVQGIARRLGQIMARFSRSGKSSALYWCVETLGNEIEQFGVFNETDWAVTPVAGPTQKKWGRGTHLLPVIKYGYETIYKQPEQAIAGTVGAIITDGIIEDEQACIDYCYSIGQELSHQKPEPFKLTLIGIGSQVDEGQLARLDNMFEGTDVDYDLWSAGLVPAMQTEDDILAVLFGELMTEDIIVAATGFVEDGDGRQLARWPDGMPGAFRFKLPKGQTKFIVRTPQKDIEQDLSEVLSRL